MNIDSIFDNNQKWVSSKEEDDGQYFERLAKGQSPEMLYIGCSDSRVTAEEMIGAQPGDLFVHRNIANMVPNTDLSAMSVINYAVSHLHVKNIVVCGHYGCGGVLAAMQPKDLGVLNPWLRNIRDVYRLHQDELDEIGDTDQRYKRLVELNVQEQCMNVLKTPEVQLAYGSGDLTIHGWVLDLSTGKIIDLNINVAEKLEGIREIYRLS
ncbi:MAG: carbonic anhydrase [Pirellulaceae bacterium]|nr:carbonic anhydrase [Pirellulaceae bacterium]